MKVTSHQTHGQNYENFICTGVGCKFEKDKVTHEMVKNFLKVKEEIISLLLPKRSALKFGVLTTKLFLTLL